MHASLVDWRTGVASMTKSLFISPDSRGWTGSSSGCSQLVVCLDCGFAEFTVPESEVRLLGQDTGPKSTC